MDVAGAVTIAAACTAAAKATVLSLASSAASASDEARSGAMAADSPLPTPSHECAVCLSELPARAQPSGSEPAVRTLPACGHAFHADCIGTWLPLRPECPLCRRTVLRADADGKQQTVAAAPAWARPATIVACGFGDGRVVWTRSPSTRQ